MRLLTTAILCILLASACRPEQPVLPHQAALNTWEVSDKVFIKNRSRRYFSVLSGDSQQVVQFLDADTGECNSISLYFIEPPVTGRDYRVVYNPDTTDEVSIEESQVNSHHSGSNDEKGGTLQVRTIDGKLVFIASEVEVENYNWVSSSYRTVS